MCQVYKKVILETRGSNGVSLFGRRRVRDEGNTLHIFQRHSPVLRREKAHTFINLAFWSKGLPPCFKTYQAHFIFTPAMLSQILVTLQVNNSDQTVISNEQQLQQDFSKATECLELHRTLVAYFKSRRLHINAAHLCQKSNNQNQETGTFKSPRPLLFIVVCHVSLLRLALNS